MSNHEIRCRGCGADLRREGESHEARCLADELQKLREIADREVRDRIAAEGKLKAADEAWHEQEDELQALRGKLEAMAIHRQLLEALQEPPK